MVNEKNLQYKHGTCKKINLSYTGTVKLGMTNFPLIRVSPSTATNNSGLLVRENSFPVFLN